VFREQLQSKEQSLSNADRGRVRQADWALSAESDQVPVCGPPYLARLQHRGYSTCRPDLPNPPGTRPVRAVAWEGEQ